MDLVPTSKPGKFYKGETELPVIVTGASMNHMHEVEALFERLNTLVRPDYPSIKVYFYDLGLTSWQRAEVSSVSFEHFISNNLKMIFSVGTRRISLVYKSWLFRV